MLKIKHFTHVYHSVLFFCSKRCQIKFDTLIDYENQQQQKLQNIATDHSPDIDYKDFTTLSYNFTTFTTLFYNQYYIIST